MPTYSWNYLEAQKTIPHVQRLLIKMREGYVQLNHLRCLEYRTLHREQRQNWGAAVRSKSADLMRIVHHLRGMNVYLYEGPWRGIAIYPMRVMVEKKIKNAYYVYKDSRPRIDTFVLEQHLRRLDLCGYELPIPATWMTPEAPAIVTMPKNQP